MRLTDASRAVAWQTPARPQTPIAHTVTVSAANGQAHFVDRSGLRVSVAYDGVLRGLLMKLYTTGPHNGYVAPRIAALPEERTAVLAAIDRARAACPSLPAWSSCEGAARTALAKGRPVF